MSFRWLFIPTLLAGGGTAVYVAADNNPTPPPAAKSGKDSTDPAKMPEAELVEKRRLSVGRQRVAVRVRVQVRHFVPEQVLGAGRPRRAAAAAHPDFRPPFSVRPPGCR